MSTANSSPLLTPTEVSEETGVALATLNTWRTRGGGPRYVKLGRRVAYKRTDLDAWIDANTRVHTA
jgi:predicted DNA-binding transcriptional regulator AlpA